MIELLSFRPLEEIEGFKKEIADGKNPRDIKFLLCEEIIERFHNQASADKAKQDFIQRFQKNAIPDDIDEVSISLGEGISIGYLAKETGLCPSTSDAMRMVKQGAVKINGEKIGDPRAVIADSAPFVLQVGKRKFVRVMPQ